jgi:nucleotide-binding universal stress UspA family protein
MYRTLIVPLDGSELAERALPHAERLAQADHGRLVLQRVAIAPLPPVIDNSDWEQLQFDAVTEAEQYLAEVAARLDGRVPVETAVPYAYGRAARAILDGIATFAADGVVMATHGRTGLPHLLHGSTAEAVLAESPVPVFLVHPRPGEASGTPFDPVSARLMVPLDGSAFAEAALRPALDLLDSAGELVLVAVAEPPDRVLRDENGRVLAYLDQQEQARKLETREYLMAVATRLRQQDPGVRISIDVRVGRPAPSIVLAAVERVVDVVVMATHGRTGLGRAILGSVAGEVLRTGSTPVLLVHPLTEGGRPTEPMRGARPTPRVVA